MNEELDMIAKRMDLLGVRVTPSRRTAFMLRRVEATSLADLSARLLQQLNSSRANDERIRQSLRQSQ